MSDPWCAPIPKACGCSHISDNGGYTCRQAGNSYRCSNCLRQDRDEAIRERDLARYAARELWEFIEEGAFRDGLEAGEVGSPEYELWVRGMVAGEVWFHIMRHWPAEERSG